MDYFQGSTAIVARGCKGSLEELVRALKGPFLGILGVRLFSDVPLKIPAKDQSLNDYTASMFNHTDCVCNDIQGTRTFSFSFLTLP